MTPKYFIGDCMITLHPKYTLDDIPYNFSGSIYHTEDILRCITSISAG